MQTKSGTSWKMYEIIGLIIGVTILFAAIVSAPPKGTAGTYDELALCLRDKKVTMYGADWCPHCQSEKREFGSSFQFIPYVECPADPQKCLAAGIEEYPTWIFPDGKRLVGEQGPEKLAGESGCRIMK